MIVFLTSVLDVQFRASHSLLSCIRHVWRVPLAAVAMTGLLWAGPAMGQSALDFTAPDTVAVADASDLNTSDRDQRTIEAWFKVNDASISSRKQVIWEEGGSDFGFNLYVFDGALYVGAYDSGTWLKTSAVESGTWQHVVLMYDNLNGVFKGYLNGTEFDNAQPQGAIGSHGDNIGIGAVRGFTEFHDGTSSDEKRVCGHDRRGAHLERPPQRLGDPQ
jgi:hypothetical protein